jgi:hypothetical protein
MRPTLVARPEEVFGCGEVNNEAMCSHFSNVSSPSTYAKASVPPTREQFKSEQPDLATPAPWNAAAALLQLKLALGDVPKLHHTVGNADADAVTWSSPPSAALTNASQFSAAAREAPLSRSSPSCSATFLPPVVRYNSAATSPLTSGYAQRTLCGIVEACNRLEKKLRAKDAGKKGTFIEDLRWAHVMHCLREPELVAQLQRRADAAIWEKVHAYRVNYLLNEELRARRVPAEIAQDNFQPFLHQVQQSRAMLERYLYTQRAIDAVAPSLEAAAVRAESLHEVASMSSPKTSCALETMKCGMKDLTVQVRKDTDQLQRNMEALLRRLDALKPATAAALPLCAHGLHER